LSGQRGAFVSNGPYIIVRAGPRFFVHDTVPEPDLGGFGLRAARYVVIDTLQQPPKAGYGMPGPCWTHECLCTRARSVREPSWSVWAHVIYSDGKQRLVGWALMTPDPGVDGPNCF
jgi:hypothetical protein